MKIARYIFIVLTSLVVSTFCVGAVYAQVDTILSASDSAGGSTSTPMEVVKPVASIQSKAQFMLDSLTNPTIEQIKEAIVTDPEVNNLDVQIQLREIRALVAKILLKCGQ